MTDGKPRTRSFDDVKAEILQDPKFRAAYEATEPWYERECRRIQRRIDRRERRRLWWARVRRWLGGC